MTFKRKHLIGIAATGLAIEICNSTELWISDNRYDWCHGHPGYPWLSAVLSPALGLLGWPMTAIYVAILAAAWNHILGDPFAYRWNSNPFHLTLPMEAIFKGYGGVLGVSLGLTILIWRSSDFNLSCEVVSRPGGFEIFYYLIALVTRPIGGFVGYFGGWVIWRLISQK